ncbi:mevalonate kinase-like [Formica exsecta]|uniref:mevalonate kinase-like n=1 Tax=Formica exsecta TaxID=72781 RepID=UPI001143A016|nr:mevalonate kinase-like [Formica exsecta]
MITFKISAPGRIILSGEHTVMYGKKVVAAGIDLRTMLNFYETTSSGIIEIDFPDVGLLINIPLEHIQNFISSSEYNNIINDNILFLRHIQYFITLNGMWRTYPQRFSIQTFFFLLLFIAHHEALDIKPCYVRLTTQLKMGAGLGSSTSFAVCLAAGFLHWARLQKGGHIAFNNQDLEIISEYAMHCEEVIQNYLFNIDHDVCTFGRGIIFQYKELLNGSFTPIDVPEMNILLIDSNICQHKGELIRQVAEAKHLYDNAVDRIFDTIDNISQEVATALREIGNCHRNNNLQRLHNLYEALQINITLNQDMLHHLNLSNQNFDIICTIAKAHGFAGKLTGVGARYVLILLPPNTLIERTTVFCQQLRSLGFNFYTTKICCSGVRFDELSYAG